MVYCINFLLLLLNYKYTLKITGTTNLYIYIYISTLVYYIYIYSINRLNVKNINNICKKTKEKDNEHRGICERSLLG